MPDYVSHFVEAEDGLKLHVRDYGVADPSAPTVLCLHGLARNSADFDVLARHLLAADPRRRVVVPDYRGRGLSDHDPNPDNYDLPVEARDIQAIAAALGIATAVVVGTSRGGLHALVIAAMRPTFLRGVVLNDIGPVIESSGLARIRGYVGKLPQPQTWDEAVGLLRGVASTQFTAIAEADWRHYAETTFEKTDSGFVPRYDPALMHNLAKLDLDNVPTLWPQFEALAAVPVLVIRGANSDLLSEETLAGMVARHPDCRTLTVPGQGHAPLLTDPLSVETITAFVAHCETAASAAVRADEGLALLS